MFCWVDHSNNESEQKQIPRSVAESRDSIDIHHNIGKIKDFCSTVVQPQHLYHSVRTGFQKKHFTKYKNPELLSIFEFYETVLMTSENHLLLRFSFMTFFGCFLPTNNFAHMAFWKLHSN